MLWSLPTGLYVIGSRAGDRRNLMTCSWVMQVATSPKLVAAAIERSSVTLELIEQSGCFTISVLSRDDRALIRRFVKPVEDVELDAEGRATSMQRRPGRRGSRRRAATGRRAGLARVLGAGGWSVPTPTIEEDGAISHRLVIGEVTDVGGPLADDDAAGAAPERPEVLRMEDTRMNYGG